LHNAGKGETNMHREDFPNAPYAPLPSEVLDICRAVDAPPRLMAHLILVHDVAITLVEELLNAFPDLKLDREAILFGAATHDIGKAAYPQELTAPGKLHEAHGQALLLSLGVSEHRARFALTHGNWQEGANTTIEDIVVALADNCWKGKRNAELESELTSFLATATHQPQWQCFATLDTIVEKLAADADRRLAWQQQFPARSAPASQ
jgi:HD domain